MDVTPIELKPEETARIRAFEKKVNHWVRRLDDRLEKLHLGGRKGRYDDENFEFMGGSNDGLRKKHYD
ncbi:MAG: hypothetical protein JRH10_22265, partial [Deltaproteobacteria bacterium]|nr:hypothetical protein [Deltaproteobacteria bacterium]